VPAISPSVVPSIGQR